MKTFFAHPSRIGIAKPPHGEDDDVGAVNLKGAARLKRLEGGNDAAARAPDARAGASRFDEKHAADPLRDHPLERELGAVVRAQKVEHRFHLGASAQELRRVGLRVAADEHHLESHFGERKRNVRGGRRFSDAAFAVEGKAEHRTGFFVGTVEFEIGGFEGRGLNRRHGRTK